MSGARGGRLPAGLDQAMQALNTSVDVDRVLWREDIQGSIEHARGLGRAGIISSEDAVVLVDGLEKIASEIEDGKFVWDPQKEDVHMNIEARLVEICGSVGGKLHTGRSRNDQVATDLRLWTRRRAGEVRQALSDLGNVILDVSEREIDVLMPSYTHLQRAQPSRLSHHLMAWQEMLWRDRGRLDGAVARLNECPLGAGAVAGSGFPLDREGVARALGFERPMRNSIDATASRDFLMELASCLAILAVHLSRIGEEVVLWSSLEFGFLTLDDGFATSSSMMPQKKNPDVAELIRGKSARLIGCVTTLLALEKGLSFGYARDLQEDKAPIIEAFSDVLLGLKALTGALGTARFNREALEGALERGYLAATDVADLLVTSGLPFREAHKVVGALVRDAETRCVRLEELPNGAIEQLQSGIDVQAVRDVLEPSAAVERRALLGGPAKARVTEAISDARRRWNS